ncbi:MT-A70 family protein [Histomonas meleagridis]|uniref:MT-A70 family protein n=1 Tax=Histomonas meleagridis TaxID=135588 RepID=UPI003559F40A|nr:MT-A70 family protein [Histomonas meleagridis]KAH0804681.1 MT-A70 family protein [Histomonas meleagridis]
MSERCRKRKPVAYYDSSSDESFEDTDDSDFEDSEELESYSKRSNSKKKQEKRTRRKERSTKLYNKKKNKRKTPFVGSLSIDVNPKSFNDYSSNDLNHDPAGNPCRFVPYSKIKDNILNPEKYMKPGEKGVLTFIPNWNPNNSDHLSQFGYKQELAKTDHTYLTQLTLRQLEDLLEKTEQEIQSLPLPKENTTVAIPGFSTTLEDSIAINADVRDFDWAELGRHQKFDVITMDPPWPIATSNVTRGVNIPYEQLDASIIAQMPLHYVQDRGYLFMWVIASQLTNGVTMLKHWGYQVVGHINWVKISKYGRYMPSHGYYFQHNKETLLIGLKGEPPSEMNRDKFQSLLVNQRGIRQSQKPDSLYEMIEEIFPGLMYLEVFARPHNLRNGWVSIGIELPT